VTPPCRKNQDRKKVAVLEGSKSAHYKEVARSRTRLQDAEKELLQISGTLEKLKADEAL
jgi:hypothetical protein